MKIITVHGLNVAPATMHTLVSELELNHSGIENIVLKGHEPHLEDKLRIKGITRAKWQEWISEYDDHVKTIEGDYGVIVFSLGGLISLYNMVHSESNAPKKIVLLAPALAFRNWTHGWKIFGAVPKLQIPSMSPVHTKANHKTPINAYKQLFRLRKKLNQCELNKLNVDLKLFLHQKDELVSPKGIRKFIDRHELDKWSVHYFGSKKKKRKEWKHLIIDPAYLDEHEWEEMKLEIQKYWNG